MTTPNVFPLQQPTEISPDALTEVIQGPAPRNSCGQPCGPKCRHSLRSIKNFVDENAVHKQVETRDAIIAFYRFPSEHWKHIRTTNPVESVFSTVRNRTRKTMGRLSRKIALVMVFKLMQLAKNHHRRVAAGLSQK